VELSFFLIIDVGVLDFDLPSWTQAENRALETPGALAPSIAPSGLEPQATFWVEPQAGFWAQPGLS
jgi:hypothetical protein